MHAAQYTFATDTPEPTSAATATLGVLAVGYLVGSVSLALSNRGKGFASDHAGGRPCKMLSRRALIGNLCVTSALSGLPISAAFAAPSWRPMVAIVDKLLPGAPDMAARYRGARTEVQQFAGDPGKLWLQTIEPQLRAEPAAIAGYTSASTLFCLQYLARDYGLALKAHAQGVGELDAMAGSKSELLDLRDSTYSDRRAAYSWLLAPIRG